MLRVPPLNAFEADGALHVDRLTYPDAAIIERLRLDKLRADTPPLVASTLVASTLTRFSIPLQGAAGEEPVAIEGEALCDTRLELPRSDYTRRVGRP